MAARAMSSAMPGLPVAIAFILVSGPAQANRLPEQILRAADQARGNISGITWDIELQSVSTRRDQYMNFGVNARGFDLLAESSAPPKHKGKRLLMINGNMWFHRPGLSKAVPIARRQRLMGQAAYGDIAATNYARDYDAARLADDIIAGEECHVFDLHSKKKTATYDRITYWVSKNREVGIKAHYFTVSGKLFKSATMEYANIVTVAGQRRPFISMIRIVDELASQNVTTLTFRNPSPEDLPDYLFNLNLFGR